MIDEPLVSVIMPTYNRANIIFRSIDSVLSQKYNNWELLIIDDMSTDRTNEVIEKYSKNDSRVKYLVNQRKKGPSGARNHGILNAQGKYIAFLDSDDMWMEHHLSDSINILENENVKVSFALWIEKAGDKEFKYGEKPEIKEVFENAINELKPKIKDNYYIFGNGLYEFTRFNYFYFFQINTMVFDKTILQTIDLFDENIGGSEDVDFSHKVYAYYDTCIIWNYHFYYFQGIDNLYFFSGRKSIKPDDIVDNKPILTKFSKNIINECVYIKKRIKFMKKLTILKNRKKSIEIGYQYLIDKLLTVAYINKKLEKLLALKYCLISFKYGFHREQLYVLGKIILPFLFDRFKIEELNLILQ
jgi:glycosyltransferase involved in cell wall biosynthesis